ncbi:hypothetical protein CH063_04779, partial [Colletotrichum higginsianum]
RTPAPTSPAWTPSTTSWATRRIVARTSSRLGRRTACFRLSSAGEENRALKLEVDNILFSDVFQYLL